MCAFLLLFTASIKSFFVFSEYSQAIMGLFYIFLLKITRVISDKTSMTKRIIIAAILMLLWAARGLFAQGLDGVYQIELEGMNKEPIARGTGFGIRSYYSQSEYILTSFHLLNARLVEAGALRVKKANGEIEYLKIAAYDELNDILLLSKNDVAGESFYLTSKCENGLNVAGFYKERMLVMDAKNFIPTDIYGVKKLPVYLNKGFSGAPVFNNGALVCGMVVLSSEMNANSVAVSSVLLNELIKKYESGERKFYSVRDVKRELGVENISQN
ncbi:MAG: hypothetical protein V1647_01150 [Pseudomonadota bacterium]